MRLARVLPARRPPPAPEPEPREAPRRPELERGAGDRLRDSVTGLEDEVLEQAATLEALQKRVGALEDLQEAAEKARSERADLNAQVKNLAENVRSSRGRIDRLTKDLSSLDGRFAALPDTIEPGVSGDRLNRELTKLARALRREFQELAEGIKNQMPEVPEPQQLEKRLEALSQKLETAAKSRKSADDAERQKWQKEADKRLTRLEKVLEDAAKRSAQASTVAVEMKALERRVATLEPALAEAKELAAKFKERLAAVVEKLEADGEERKRREEHLAERLQEIERQGAGAEAHTEKLIRDEVEPLATRIDELASGEGHSAKLNDLEERINATLGNIVSRIARSEEQAARADETLRAASEELRKLSHGLAVLARGSAGLREDLAREGFRYFAFEDLHRGPSDVVKGRQRSLVQFFEQCRDVLDVGCGRGEFLELAAEHGIGARGIDVDEDMILHCQRKGLKVERAEAASYLSSLPEKSLDGIFAAHVLEHMDPVEVLRFVKLAYQRLKFGTHLVVETVNPLCLNALSTSFYLDPTHARPIHPDMLHFMLQAAGFRDSAVQFELPFDTEPLPDAGAEGDPLVLVLRAVRQLQRVVFGPRDYFVRALK